MAEPKPRRRLFGIRAHEQHIDLLATFKKGALKTTFKFERTPKGLVCNATEIHIQETGADKIRLNSEGGGGR